MTWDPKTQEFAIKVLDHMLDKLSDYQEKYGDLYNLEATPAESTSYRLAKHDRKKWPDIKCAGKNDETSFYTNSTNLPVGYTDDIFEALTLQDKFQVKYTGGSVFHAFLGEKAPDWKTIANLVRKISENFELPLFTISPTYSICKDCGYINGEEYTCPTCGLPTEVYSRITGYYRPVQHWNKGKAQEFKKRKTYTPVLNIKNTETKKQSSAQNNINEEITNNTTAKKILFTSKTCPNCPAAKQYLNNVVGIKNIDAQENIQLSKKYNVMSVPTFVIDNGNDYIAYRGLNNIMKYQI